MLSWQLQNGKQLGTMDYVNSSITGLAKTVWRELDCRLSIELKNYQQQLPESYQQQDQETEMTEKHLKRLTTPHGSLGLEGEVLADFAVMEEEGLAHVHFLTCAGFLEQKV